MAKTTTLTSAQAVVLYLQHQYSDWDGDRQRLIPGMFGIFGHGNVAGLGQALEEYGMDLPFYQAKNEQSMVHAAIGFAKAKNRRSTLGQNVADNQSFWNVDPEGELNVILRQITVPNGLAWSPDGRTMYFADTRRHVIFQFDYDIDAGLPYHQRLFVDLSSYEGLPDGATVDADGCLWSAMFSGGRIVRYTPKGKIDRVIGLPVTQVNSLTFGGSDLRTIFVVTSKHLLNEGGLAAQPLAGDIFAIDAGVTGRPEPPFAG
jgi:sugar lactone lactonase YvrE